MRNHAFALSIVLLGSIAISACSTLTNPWNAAETARREGVSHHVTVLHDAAVFAEGGAVTAGEIREEPRWLALHPTGTEPETLAAYQSPVVISAIRFNEALLSWNVDVAEDYGVRFDLRVGDSRTGEWSPWLYMGRWGADVLPGERSQQSDFGYIDIDYFRSERHFDLAQYRVTAAKGRRAAASTDGEGEGGVFARRFALTFSGRAPVPEEHPRLRPTRSAPAGAPNWVTPVTLDVPFRSQKTERREISGRICSPTSVTMVMAYRGVDQPVSDVAARAFDHDFDLYGNWPNNVQTAYTYGVPGYLTRLSDWAEVRRLLARGQPLIASIQARRGDLRGAPYRGTDGHLIVIRGLDENGDALVNDPASTTPEEGVVTYKREDMQRVWLERTAGTTYVLLPREGE